MNKKQVDRERLSEENGYIRGWLEGEKEGFWTGVFVGAGVSITLTAGLLAIFM